MRLRFGLLVLLAAGGLALAVPTLGIAGPSGAQSFHKLIEFTGKGPKNSRTFRIKSSSIQVAYSFSTCPNGSGDFIVDLVGRGFNHIVVNRMGSHGKKRVWAYPRPGQYHLSVNTTCRWYVSVWGK